MHIDYLIHMANDIGAFFVSEGDEHVAADGIHQHIRKFWDPRMRASIISYYRETGGPSLEGAVRLAVQKLAQEQPVQEQRNQA